MQNKISIIMVCKNSARTIEDSINSFFLQEYKNKELIIIDGGSTDKTIEIIEKLNCHNYFESINGLGLYASINHAINKCDGNVIGILHSDDTFFDKFVLQKINQEFNKNKFIDYVYSDIIFVDHFENIKRKWIVGNLKVNDVFKGKFPPHTGIFVKKSSFEYTNKYNESYKISSDTEYIFKLMTSNKLRGSYLSSFTIKMKLGGLSTRSIKNILIGNLESYDALKKLKIGYLKRFQIILFKVSRKFIQILKI